jgi:hypothetical protein
VRLTCFCSIIVLAAGAAQAVPQNDLSAVGGAQSRGLFGEGLGVKVAILDGGIDVNHPANRGSLIAARDFSHSGTTDDERNNAGHATGIASLYIGHAGDFRGLVPQAKLINVRVIDARDSTSDAMAGNGLFYATGLGAKVINMSLGNRLGDGPLSNKFNLMVDYASEAYGASIVSAGGNEEDTAVAQVPAGAYNGYSIGSLASSRYDQVSSFSNYSLSSDRRTKPDLVAPGERVQRATANWEASGDYALGYGTSFSTPIVGGVLAQMVGYGQSRGLPTDPRLLKAIVLTAADKEYDFDGDPWAPRHQATNKRGVLIVDRPLDDEQGAGRIDAVAAHTIFSRSKSSSTPVTGWKFGSVQRGQTVTMDLGRISAGQRIDSTIVWDRHVTRRDDGDGVVDAGDAFSETAPLANFVLRLLKNGSPVAVSDSPYDNFEHLSIRVRRSGRFSLELFRSTGGGIKNEIFGFAARVLNNPPILSSLDAEPAIAQAAPNAAQGVSRSLDPNDIVAPSVPEPSTVGAAALIAATRLLKRRRRPA